MELTLAFWKENRISFDDFLTAWVLEQGSYSLSRRISRVRKVLQKPDIADAIGLPLVLSPSSDTVFHSEFEALIGRPFFNHVDVVEMSDKLDEIDFSHARQEISLHAPGWAELLSGLLQNSQNSRAGQDSYPQAKTTHDGPFYIITALICRSRARMRADFFAKAIGLYLLGNNVKRRVVEVISGFGVCDSYKVINREFNKIAKYTELK